MDPAAPNRAVTRVAEGQLCASADRHPSLASSISRNQGLDQRDLERNT